ncbi:dipeptide/oligopeptide/nickel ABC transporter permease/ATP-binding protein [Nonomuraea typhae]|uniref:dipeptide/oligopeptide/nickel ABC transporter permease/ATP-binding protein n=1 Tax=Nonomuraea typhae TaxID=2603600 RepID=UPI0012FAB667|nr:dipeptide/oligopeptide/nickel ABC transporter permease/ATP-binding protein [Nonomuraea typhae]
MSVDQVEVERVVVTTGWARVLRRLVRQPLTLVCMAFLLLLVAAAVFAPWLAPHDPSRLNVPGKLAGPSAGHWLGTDELGRDQLSRIIYGSRVALRASLQAVALALLVGVPLGLVIGYLGGWWDRVAMRLVDAISSLPALLLAFGVIAVLGRGLTNAMLAIGVVFGIHLLRLTRGAVLVEREQPYVDAARVLGLSTPRIVFGQILPNVAGPLIVQSAIFLGLAQLFEATLSFLGLGIEVGDASWGQMLDKSRAYAAQQPWLPVFPGLAITLTVLAFNLLGDGIRDAMGRHGDAVLPWRRRTPKATPTPAADGGALLQVHDLRVEFPGQVAVGGIGFDVAEGEVFGIVGESGSGKSMTALALAGLVPPPGEVTSGSVRLAGRELIGLSDADLAAVRGPGIGMVFQDPVSALSPVHTIGRQLCEPLRTHEGLSRRAARERAAELLTLVGVPDAKRRLKDYPHQFSGGMAQRVVIARALAARPKLLIADEPTTALDVTIQRQVLDLLLDLREGFGMTIILITHDLAVVADACDRVAVMREGRIVETAPVDPLFNAPAHDYTKALIAATPTGVSPC